nr:MAG TPA: hypothetical protein [Bacteriophage sp.]
MILNFPCNSRGLLQAKFSVESSKLSTCRFT